MPNSRKAGRNRGGANGNFDFGSKNSGASSGSYKSGASAKERGNRDGESSDKLRVLIGFVLLSLIHSLMAWIALWVLDPVTSSVWNLSLGELVALCGVYVLWRSVGSYFFGRES